MAKDLKLFFKKNPVFKSAQMGTTENRRKQLSIMINSIFQGSLSSLRSYLKKKRDSLFYHL